LDGLLDLLGDSFPFLRLFARFGFKDLAVDLVDLPLYPPTLTGFGVISTASAFSNPRNDVPNVGVIGPTDRPGDGNLPRNAPSVISLDPSSATRYRERPSY
jgi:hypothetical protein